MCRIVTGSRVMEINVFLSKFTNVRLLIKFKGYQKLKGMNLSSLGIKTPVYINDSLRSYYKILWQKCKKLW